MSDFSIVGFSRLDGKELNLVVLVSPVLDSALVLLVSLTRVRQYDMGTTSQASFRWKRKRFVGYWMKARREMNHASLRIYSTIISLTMTEHGRSREVKQGHAPLTYEGVVYPEKFRQCNT